MLTLFRGVDAVFHNPLLNPKFDITFLQPNIKALKAKCRQRGHEYPLKPGIFEMNSSDFHRIHKTLQVLQTTGYYYGGLSWRQATELLQDTAIGTFLIRESSDSSFLFSLSVNTERGPTSVRIHYINGQFRLDSEESIAGFMPIFDCVVQLVEYYVRLSKSSKGATCVWLDNTGRRDLPICLSRPLYHSVLSLKHLCRLVVNGRLHSHTDWISEVVLRRLGLPQTLVSYLREYPYLH
ncbi:suppressor of cytokine signaling 2-like [Centruroides sculpturatus]|uniref:suppressor of cytokine signaling 2-like n=1 Tax=Centruroides sculpturatus TaxID=218467 RepID=UPI000C6E984F|nr:suppressor of cytokine signaling 2-like [Centruroides sculpturatus]